MHFFANFMENSQILWLFSAARLYWGRNANSTRDISRSDPRMTRKNLKKISKKFWKNVFRAGFVMSFRVFSFPVGTLGILVILDIVTRLERGCYHAFRCGPDCQDCQECHDVSEKI